MTKTTFTLRSLRSLLFLFCCVCVSSNRAQSCCNLRIWLLRTTCDVTSPAIPLFSRRCKGAEGLHRLLLTTLARGHAAPLEQSLEENQAACKMCLGNQPCSPSWGTNFREILLRKRVSSHDLKLVGWWPSNGKACAISISWCISLQRMNDSRQASVHGLLTRANMIDFF